VRHRVCFPPWQDDSYFSISLERWSPLLIEVILFPSPFKEEGMGEGKNDKRTNYFYKGFISHMVQIELRDF